VHRPAPRRTHEPSPFPPPGSARRPAFPRDDDDAASPGTATRPELRLDALLNADRTADLDPVPLAPPRDLEQPTIVSDGVGALVAFVVLVVLLLTFVLWVLPYLLVG
jgi:hypothetical protein